MQLTASQRAGLFWLVCIPVRSGIAAIALSGDKPVLRAGATLVGARWLLGYEMGVEGVFGGPAWWRDERQIHGALWAVYAATGDGRYLVADTAFGALNWFSKA